MLALQDSSTLYMFHEEQLEIEVHRKAYERMLKRCDEAVPDISVANTLIRGVRAQDLIKGESGMSIPLISYFPKANRIYVDMAFYEGADFVKRAGIPSMDYANPQDLYHMSSGGMKVIVKNLDDDDLLKDLFIPEVPELALC